MRGVRGKKEISCLWAAQSALRDAGLLEAGSARGRCGVALAVGVGANRLEDIERWAQPDGQFDPIRFGREWPLIDRESILRNNSNRAAALLARRFGLAGNNITVNGGLCVGDASHRVGVSRHPKWSCRHDGCRWRGLHVQSGGDDLFVLLKVAAVSATGATRSIVPLTGGESGLVMAEGAAIAVLEEESRARERGRQSMRKWPVMVLPWTPIA